MNIILSQYVIRKTKQNCFNVYRRGKKLENISSNITDRRDAEILVSELASNKITEKAARKESAEENFRLNRN